MLWVPEGTLSQKMTENILIVNFHTISYHKMTLLGLWRANLGLKLTPKGQIWHDFVMNCNFSHIFSICDMKMFKFLCSPLIRPQWSFLGVLWLYQCPKWTPKGPNLTSFVPRYSLLIQFAYLSPKHIYMFFTSNEVPMVIFRHFVILSEYIILTFGAISYFRLDCHELVWRFFKAAL